MTPEQKLLHDAEFTPQFLSNEEETLFAEAFLGREAIDFLNSDLGRVLRGYADQKISEAKDKLLDANPSSMLGRRKIQKLQFDAAVASQFLAFIQEALMRGNIAEQTLKQYRGE